MPPLSGSDSADSASHHSAEPEPLLPLDDCRLLSADQLRQINQFRQDAQRCVSDTERYALCERTRDRLLDQQASLDSLIATLDRVMRVECRKYKSQRSKMQNQDRSGGDGAAEWERFVNAAEEGSRCLTRLKAVGRIWGQDKVQHYRWAEKGESYCNKLSAAAREVSDWDEAATKLSILINRRVHQFRRRWIKDSINPIEPDDLINLKLWSHKEPFVKKNDKGVTLPFRKLALEELPEGYGFDRFSVMVLEQYAVELPGAGIDEEDSTTPAPSDEGDKTASATEALDEIVVGGAQDAESPGSGWASDDARAAQGQDTAAAANSSSGRGGRTLRPRTQKAPYRETPEGKTSKPKHAPPGHVQVARMLQKRCCPEEIPPSLLSALDNPSAFGVDVSQLDPSHLELLCVHHLREVAKVLSVGSIPLEAGPATIPLEAGSATTPHEPGPSTAASPTGARGLRRARSPHDMHHGEVFKRLRFDEPNMSLGGGTAGQPMHDPDGDDACRRQVLAELRQQIDQKKSVPESHGEATNDLILALLQVCEQPNTDETVGRVEVLFLSGHEAGAMVECGAVDMPIVTDPQQQFRWSGKGRPTEELFRRMVDLQRLVSVQVPSRKTVCRSFEPRKLAEIQRRFVNRKDTDDPWNVLDLANPLPHSVLPYFRTGPNCQLLSRVRDIVLMGSSGEQTVATKEAWSHWRDVQEWILLGEGGHHTAPHTDGNGYATWITVQEGLFGFGWLSHPTRREMEDWTTIPDLYTGGRWRYIILRPGQTVFFGPGTVHFVFRPKREQTLAVGGHVLQWTGLAQWASVVIEQVKHPNITNEEVRESAGLHIRAVANLVGLCVRDGRVEQLGGKAAIDEFFDLAKVRLLFAVRGYVAHELPGI